MVIFDALNGLSLTQVHDAIVNNTFGGCVDITPDCLDLTVQASPDTTFITESVCAGECFIVDGQNFCSTGTFVVNIPQPGSCDSVVILNLTVIQVLARITQPDLVTCTNTVIMLNGNTSTAGPGAT
jgi:hypothetical protein